MKTLQRFSSVHAQVQNHFNQKRHLVTGKSTSKDALLPWPSGVPLPRRWSAARADLSPHVGTPHCLDAPKLHC